jgi:hypothetical protein
MRGLNLSENSNFCENSKLFSKGLLDVNQRRSYVPVPDMGAGCCLGPKGNGVSLEGGGGGEGGPDPPGDGEDKQSVLSEGRNNMDKDEEGRASGLDEDRSTRAV